MKMIGAVDHLAGLLAEGEEKLAKRFLRYTSANEDFGPFIIEGWQLTIHFLTETFIASLNARGVFTSLFSDDPEDPYALFVKTEVIKHRQKAFDLKMLILLFKLYRKVFTEYISDDLSDPECYGSKPAWINYVERTFDHIELCLIREWMEDPCKTQYAELFHIEDNIRELERYVCVLDSLFAPVILIDKELCVVNMNLAAAGIFPEIKIGCNLGAGVKFPGIDELYRAVRNFERLPVNEYQYKTKIQDARCFKVILKRLSDPYKSIPGTVIMFQDITEQHLIEENLQQAIAKAEESDRLKTAFLANMSHEIRTPMNAIIGFTDLMLNEKYAKNDKNEFLKLIRRSSNDLLNIIEDIIDIAKMESKQYKIRYKICNPYSIFCDLKVVFKETLRRFGVDNDIELRLKVSDELQQLLLYTDGERLKQIISNLLNNAVKFTNKGYIECGFERYSDTQLLFFVRDSGVGIPAKMKGKIFDRFVQVEEHLFLNAGGTGLGLAICKNIVALLGGKIWVESKINEGSVFFFVIPFKDIPEELRNNNSALLEFRSLPDHQWKDKTILIAEDDEINYLFLREALARSGARIIHASNGITAIDMVESADKIDLILMDIKMPGVNGIDATKYIKGIKPHIPIIAQTAFALEGDRNKCLEAGCCAYIIKPIDVKELLVLVNQFISKAQ